MWFDRLRSNPQRARQREARRAQTAQRLFWIIPPLSTISPKTLNTLSPRSAAYFFVARPLKLNPMLVISATPLLTYPRGLLSLSDPKYCIFINYL